jgi:hypothetical protein
VGSKTPKTSWYDAWRNLAPGKHTIFTDRDIKGHGENRRKVSSMYALSNLIVYEPYVDECIAVLRGHLIEAARSNKILDMGHWLQCYAFDVVGNLTFGTPFGFLDKGKISRT